MKRYKVLITRTEHIVGECTAEYPEEALANLRKHLSGEYAGNPAYMGDITSTTGTEEQALVIELERNKRVYTEEKPYEENRNHDRSGR